ncbi:MAG: LIC_10190 family membrane protein [Chitinophagales bacterium]
MLLLFLLHIVITLLCLSAGFLSYHFSLRSKNANIQYRPVTFYLITGLIALTLVSQVMVLFFPLDGYCLLGISLLIILLLYVSRKRFTAFVAHIFNALKKQGSLGLAMIFVLWIMVLVLNAGPTMMDDTESYHIQMIKWADEYGTVPGIVNLHERFGFNSSWFISISFFIPDTHQLNFYTLLNGVISFWFCSFLAGQLSHLLARKESKSISSLDLAVILVLFFCLFGWPMIRGNSMTANYDFITTFIVSVLFIKLLQKGKETTNNPFRTEWIIWPVYLFTVRIVNYPLLLLSLYGFYFLLKSRQWRHVTLLAGIALCLVLPFIARNIMVSGYPFYPSAAFNIFNVDWKADTRIMHGLVDYIQYYNRVNEMFIPIEETAKLRFPDWVVEWFRYMFMYDKPLVVTGLAGFLLSLVFIKKFVRIFSLPLRFFVIILGMQLLSWFFIAPDPRFAYGCLLCGVMLVPILLLNKRTIIINGKILYFVCICLLTAILVYVALKPGRNKEYQNFLVPYRLPQPPVSEIIIDNIRLNVPERVLGNWNPRCYATDLPCLYIIDPRLRARGSNIRDGFRLDK